MVSNLTKIKLEENRKISDYKIMRKGSEDKNNKA